MVAVRAVDNQGERRYEDIANHTDHGRRVLGVCSGGYPVRLTS